MIYEIALATKKQSNNENTNQIPLSRILKEAIEHPIYNLKWKKAIKNELASLASFNTWKLVKQTPEMPIISCKWVFIVKYGTDDQSEQFKARLIVKDFS